VRKREKERVGARASEQARDGKEIRDGEAASARTSERESERERGKKKRERESEREKERD